MRKITIFIYLSIFVLSIAKLSASSSDFIETPKISKVKDKYWEVDVPEENLLKSFHDVDKNAIEEAENVLKIPTLTDGERRVQQARLQHEDAKLAFNLACEEYRILLAEEKIKRPKEKASGEILVYLNFVEGQEQVKKDPYLLNQFSSSSSQSSYQSLFDLGIEYYYLDAYIQAVVNNQVHNDRKTAERFSLQINEGFSNAQEGAYSDSLIHQLPSDKKERKTRFYDYFGGDKEIEDAFQIYTNNVNGGKGVHDMDVHAYNAKMNFKEFLPKMLEKDKFSCAGDSASIVIANMERTSTYANYPKQATLGKSFAGLLNHLKIQKVEVIETGVNVEEILSRIWSLIIGNDFQIDNLFTVFCDNEETHGGCFPGHAGRLADFYVKVSRSALYTRAYHYYE